MSTRTPSWANPDKPSTILVVIALRQASEIAAELRQSAMVTP